MHMWLPAFCPTLAAGACQHHQEQLYPNPSCEGIACKDAVNRTIACSTSWCQVETCFGKHESDYHTGLHPACTSWCPTAWGACSCADARALPRGCQEMQVCLAASCIQPRALNATGDSVPHPAMHSHATACWAPSLSQRALQTGSAGFGQATAPNSAKACKHW